MTAKTRTDSVQYTVTAGSETSTTTLTVTIHGHTEVPLAAAPDTGDITEDAAPDNITGNVLTNDTGGTGTKTVTAVNGTAGNVGTGVPGSNAFGTFTITATGSYTYTLDNTNATINGLNDGETRTDSVQIHRHRRQRDFYHHAHRHHPRPYRRPPGRCSRHG